MMSCDIKETSQLFMSTAGPVRRQNLEVMVKSSLLGQRMSEAVDRNALLLNWMTTCT